MWMHDIVIAKTKFNVERLMQVLYTSHSQSTECRVSALYRPQSETMQDTHTHVHMS